uniref:C-type lectin domain-containing protein n=1 Tax=Clytia hemisphaerica TaxID=252671 RepID=A0A7M5X8A3_9CNID
VIVFIAASVHLVIHAVLVNATCKSSFDLVNGYCVKLLGLKNFNNARKACYKMTPSAAVPHWAGDDASLFSAIEQLGGDYNNMKVWTSGVFIGTKYMWGVNYETPVTDTRNWKTSAAPGKCLKYKVNKKDKNNGYALADCTLYTSLLCQREKN